MKKIISLTLVGLTLITGSLLAQDAPSGPDRVPGDRPGKPGGPRLPPHLRDSDQIKTFAAEFNTFRETFQTRLAAMKKALQEASEEEKMQKRADIHELLKDHKDTQNEFRKHIRRVSRELREERISQEKGSGG